MADNFKFIQNENENFTKSQVINEEKIQQKKKRNENKNENEKYLRIYSCTGKNYFI